MLIADLTLPVYNQMLAAFEGWLAKAEVDPRGDALLGARLADDMFPLATQVRFLGNMPGETMARLAALDFTSSNEDDTTIAAARERIAMTRERIAAWRSANFAAPDAPTKLALPNGMIFNLTSEEYVRDWALPQFYFHLTAAYAILRKEGIAIGKADFVPHMAKYLRAPAVA